MIRTMLRIRARRGFDPMVQAQWRAVVDQIAASSGNLTRSLLGDANDPRTLVVVTEWADDAALREYVAGPVAARFADALADMTEPPTPDSYRVMRETTGQRAAADPAVRQRQTYVDVEITVPADRVTEFQEGHAEVVRRMADVPGYLAEELLREPGSTIHHIFARWRSEAEFRRWIDDPDHERAEAGPIAPFLVGIRPRLFEALPPAAPEETTSGAAAGTSGAAAGAAGQRGRQGAATDTTEVLIVGAGPTGLTAAIELARRGVDCQVVDKLTTPPGQADKAIGVHCRTMEIWADQGVVREAMNAGIWLTGQMVFVNGHEVNRMSWELPELPYGHLGLPQYETERILTDRLATLGVRPRRGAELVGFTSDDDGVTATLALAAGGSQTIRATYLLGADGAHSKVRDLLGLTFSGGLGRFPQLFMLGDVDVDWDMPDGHLLRFIHEIDGQLDNMLVCVPLRGESRYRIATMAPARYFAAIRGENAPPGFSAELDEPTLADVQAVLDQLAPPGTRAANLRWSSIFRICHGIVDRYGDGRVFVAGDAAHLHPPAGGQGMNTGIQDAWNLAWKLALAVRGMAAPGLLDSYQTERRPQGEEVVGRAVRLAFTDELDRADLKRQFLQEMSMLLSYAGSPIVGESVSTPDGLRAGPAPGDRAPDVAGLLRRGVGHPQRLHELTRGTRHTLLLYADHTADEAEVATVEKLCADVREQTYGQIEVYLVASADAAVPPMLHPPVVRDAEGAFRAGYGVTGTAAYLIRPDGHVGFRSQPIDAEALRGHLRLVFGGAR
ncbi:FAD-dependent monooxygenase [Solwaraspora sp. WMMD406]|uniref:FAD-dependent monooxygenase n=1 Tax=Solwaraspora sp. WMMD406 TaxID=3016095 RepID=UPI002416CFCB|nr:FAD-dependent monooxygenase [Solwaraspora sp. WMMD406]MDG4766477.1 FAD-dependent monooxygenase [Solwaraspora sp. WMMD406]